ncbi:MAG: hypothetical protein DMF61_26405 [Blastocatellia bacterium AA13]|nr:MAG: hypothetical protein DMF61_26405 [Blastocatellia bacterium AA13]
MSTTPLIDADVIQEGWTLLVEKLGLQRATQFVILLERGKGDSVQEINDYWGEANIDEIHNKVMAWKSRQQ